jgi:hypothetical protein
LILAGYEIKNPALHANNTDLIVGLGLKGSISKGALPCDGVASGGHTARTQVGAALDHVPVDETPACVHVSAILEDRKYPALQLNVAVEL